MLYEKLITMLTAACMQTKLISNNLRRQQGGKYQVHYLPDYLPESKSLNGTKTYCVTDLRTFTLISYLSQTIVF